VDIDSQHVHSIIDNVMHYITPDDYACQILKNMILGRF
jgi:hypothetical protein